MQSYSVIHNKQLIRSHFDNLEDAILSILKINDFVDYQIHESYGDIILKKYLIMDIDDFLLKSIAKRYPDHEKGISFIISNRPNLYEKVKD